jgi:hypothetical protein
VFFELVCHVSFVSVSYQNLETSKPVLISLVVSSQLVTMAAHLASSFESSAVQESEMSEVSKYSTNDSDLS